MQTTLDLPTTADLKELTQGTNPQPQKSQLDTIVLQPTGYLDHATCAAFQQSLKEALEQTKEAVIVDLLWIEATDHDGIATLVAGIQQAALSGKSLSFQAMDRRTRLALEAEWNRQRDLNFGPWSSSFQQELEQFLEQLTRQPRIVT